MRQIQVSVQIKGFRPTIIYVITSLLDQKLYPKEEIALLYKQIWNIETDIRSAKIDLGMNLLRCKTPEMIEKEVWVHVLTYNLIRLLICQAATINGIKPREISFKAAQQVLNTFRLLFLDPRKFAAAYVTALSLITTHKVGNRPDRYEPRAIKRRANQDYKLLTLPRQEARRKHWKQQRRGKKAAA